MHKANNGTAVLRGLGSSTAGRTVLVLGLPRGGTSMAAGVLAKLGIHMGLENELAPFYENDELNRAVKGKSRRQIKRIIAQYDRQYPNWGKKIMPKRWLFWLLAIPYRNPCYVVVFRDVLSVAKRQVVSLDKSLVKELFFANLFYFCILSFLAVTKRPVFLLSYEKALISPESLVEGLAEFLDIDDVDLKQSAVSFIQPTPPDYAMRSTTNSQLDAAARYFGYLDGVSPKKIVGWADSPAEDSPVGLDIVVNGERIHSVQTGLPREDVFLANPKLRKNCGFELILAETDRLKPGDRLEVKIAGKDLHLINSPYVVPV